MLRILDSESARAGGRHPRAAGHRFAVVSLVAAIFVLALGCSIPISYYDVTTYKNLTELKAVAATLVETFDTVPPADNEGEIASLLLELRKAYEYEKGKGADNSDTLQQLEKIRGLIADDIRDYREGAPDELGPAFFDEAAKVLEQAFDIAIATESAKNEDKQ